MMNNQFRFGTGLLLVAAAASGSSAGDIPAYQLMQIEKVIGGVRGNTAAQAIQLRTRGLGELQMTQARLVVHDSLGGNPLIVAAFDHDLPDSVPGTTILLATPDFVGSLAEPLPPDFGMGPIPQEYLLAGSLTYEDVDGNVYWRLSWGGEAYQGPNDGSCINDDTPCPLPGDFGPPWFGAIPWGGSEALCFIGPIGAPSTSNIDDYDVLPGPAVFNNSVGDSSPIAPPPCNDLDGDMTVGTSDLLVMLAAWGTGAGDLNGDGTTGTADLLELLSTWGPCDTAGAGYGVECPFEAECVEPELNCRFVVAQAIELIPGACPLDCQTGAEVCISPCPPPHLGLCPTTYQVTLVGYPGCVLDLDATGLPFICQTCPPGACRILMTGSSW